MAKKALLDVLEQTIGKYVLNLDAESLNVAIWTGKIELNALQLDCDAVNAELSRQAAEAPNLAIPFQVVSGEFQHFEVAVPWAHLMSRPVVLRASGLKVAVVPFDRTASADFLYAVHKSESERSQKIEDHRNKSMQLADDYRKQGNMLRELAEQDLESERNQTTEQNSGFAARLVRRIIENIQVEITDVSVTVQGSDCSAGLTLHSLSLETTDSSGRRTFVDRSKEGPEKSFLFKALQITGLGIYLDEAETTLLQLRSIGEDAEQEKRDHSYVLAPLSFEAKLRQADTNDCLDFPKYLLESELSSLSVHLSRTQLELGNKIAEQIRPSENVARPLFPEYRPLKRVTKDTAVEWWKYASRCVGRLNGRRSWVEFFRAFQRRKAYIPLYKRHANHAACSWMLALTVAELSVVEEIEKDRSISVEGIMAWRNIADAQARKEQEKHDANHVKAKGSIYTSLFGGNKKDELSKDDPPISLSVEEMQELEAVTMDQVADAELSADSRLCDVQFVLRSLRVNLSSYDERPLTSLELGTVSTSFDAHQDGSFGFELALTSLEVQDRVTPKSLFPAILRNQPNTTADVDKAFNISMTKTKSGDQQLHVRLSTFEAVASPQLLVELKQFFSLSAHRKNPTKPGKMNPILAQSLSGSIDLFYDAAGGGAVSEELPPETDAPQEERLQSAATRDDISNVLIDAWKNKTDSKACWFIDFDIQAPVIVVPENCTSPRANVLVFDLGHLKFNYGKVKPSPRVLTWFQLNKRGSGDASDQILDSGSLRISSLTFVIGKANYWRRLVYKRDSAGAPNDDEAIVEPISLSIDFGVESSAKEDVPRVCAFGVLPSIMLSMSPSQLSRILNVSSAWQERLKQVLPEAELDQGTDIDDDSCASTSSHRRRLALPVALRHTTASPPQTPLDLSSILHVDIRLKKFSVRVLDGGNSGIEAHLVSVSASTTSLSDGSSTSNLSMGWFWILDRFENDFPRKQRLVAHSTLPLPPHELAKGEKYDILGELVRQGVFADDYQGSADLADITFKRAAPGRQFGEVDPFEAEELIGEKFAVYCILDARFTSLYITWNPRAVKTMTSMLGTFAEPFTAGSKEETDGLIISNPSQLSHRRKKSFDSISTIPRTKTAGAYNMLIKATMDALQISLHSARDDLPLFSGVMASTRLSLVTSDDQNTRLHLLLGELKLESAPMGKTNPAFRTILGLASGVSDSLLSVSFYQGPKAITKLSSTKPGVCDYETYAEVELSSMRLVYIQAQVLALIEYATEGILGTITAHAASSAANAAAEIAAASELKKLFKVSASGFELLLPQSASNAPFISSRLESLQVDFTTLPDSSAEARIALCDLFMRDTDSKPLLQDPVQSDIKVELPPAQGELAIEIAISKANFVLTKNQYSQLVATLDENIGEQYLFLRDDPVAASDAADGETYAMSGEELAGLTHAGVAVVDEPRPINLRVAIDTLSLSMCGADQDDPLLQLSAVDNLVHMITFPDFGKTTIQVTLRDLVCEDQRLKASTRQYRTLVHQPSETSSGKDGDGNVFFISYESVGDNSSSIELKIGSPRIVFIPDAVSDILDYVKIERETKDGETKESVEEKSLGANSAGCREVVRVDSGGDSGVEASFVQEPEPNSVSSLTFGLQTSQCSVLLVDLGGDSLRQRGNASFMPVDSVAETIVVAGVFEAKVLMETDNATSQMIRLDTQFHGDNIEAFTAFGRDLHSAVQILDPTQVSLYVNSQSIPGKRQTTDVRCAIISPVDITLSMRNVALLNAIMTSTSDCLEDNENVPLNTVDELSQQETERIEKLANVLEADSTDFSSHSEASNMTNESSALLLSKRGELKSVAQNETSMKLTTPEMKVTIVNDLQGLDEALLRVTVRNLVANGRTQTDVRKNEGDPSFTAFSFNAHTSILADYFDGSTNLWKVLLLKPWELGLKGTREVTERLHSNRPSTAIDIESQPCHLSFSEQFLMSLASANRMWSVYSGASSSALESLDRASQKSKSVRRSMAASAARTFITSLPYALDNHAGIPMEFVINGARQERRTCVSGSMEYFRFEPPVGKGAGGKRLYGQDVTFEKSVGLVVGNTRIDLPHLDSLLGEPKVSHRLDNDRIIMTDVVKDGKTIILHVSSGIEVHNRSSIPFAVSVFTDSMEHAVGICNGLSCQSAKPSREQAPKRSKKLGIPVDFVQGFRSGWAEDTDGLLSLSFSPQIKGIPEGWFLSGGTKLKMNESVLSGSRSGTMTKCFDITCRPISNRGLKEEHAPRDLFSFVFQARVSMTLLNNSRKDPFIEVSLEPRAAFSNRMPISVTLKTPMPHVFRCLSSKVAYCDVATYDTDQNGDVATYDIEQNEHVEIFTPGPSLAVMVKCADLPVGGTATDWVDGGWIDLPLVSEFRMQEPLPCKFPFVKKSSDPLAVFGARGSDFFIVEGSSGIATLASQSSEENVASQDKNAVELSAPPSDLEEWRTFFVTVSNYAVDHTGDILFEQIVTSSEAGVRSFTSGPPLGAFSAGRYHRRVSLLPGSNVPIRLLHLTMEGDEGMQKSAPFVIEDISICDGGVDSTLVKWEDGTSSGFFAYRELVSSYQSEVHIVPEYVVFNGSETHYALFKQPGGDEMVIEPGKFAPLRTQSNETAIITVEYPELGGRTPPIRINSHGVKIVIVKSESGAPIGSFALQTVVGARDSRWVVKLGDIKFGTIQRPNQNAMLRDDFLRFRVKWSELQLTLNEARPIADRSQAVMESAFDRIQKSATPSSAEKRSPSRMNFLPAKSSPRSPETWVEARQRYDAEALESYEKSSGDAVCTILFHRFTVDWQRVFKDTDPRLSRTAREAVQSPERSQLSIVIHNVRIRDETPDSPYPVVFDSFATTSFFDLCIRFRGEADADLVQIDLLDLNLAHANGVSEKIYVNTSETFVWKILDLADRILAAAAEFAGVDIQLQWDDDQEGYVVAVREKSSLTQDESTSKYTPPKSDKMYAIKKTRVSPFKMVVSFKRNPQSSRYAVVRGIKGANIMNYFTRRLKFKIEKAVLSFARYEANDVRGPPDHIVERLTTVYMSRMKTKMITIMTAASFQDWKFLAQRDDGKDEYLEGDILRATGNIAGNSVGYVFKHAGRGLGNGVSNVTSTLGQGIESATDAIGVGALGAGVNSLVSGLGDGVGDTISGVGSGAGKVLKGAGQGVGHIIGGMTGGALLMGKGIGKGIKNGDGRAVASGLAQGATSVGNGVGNGVESVVTGATEGVLHVGQGLFSGVRTVGRGIGGAFTECCCCSDWCEEDDEHNQSSIQSPLLPRGNAA